MTIPGPPFVSRAVLATKDSSSLRVTIPQVVATVLGLRAGDELVWTVDPDDGPVRVTCRSRDHADLTPDMGPVPNGRSGAELQSG
jgi:bifunctional DNA-binding transcriptional regulator/antitoxin component of YhaV-PrlF toxin-antitoxin module